ncbi:hypothetical protein AF332_22875 [Sporosarcina globispora]|uniref:Uncharacterized protein n=1 Tax=Sporosarcina globispora TaxID=1459 RepID=A0A0M0GIR4_SPOGL|nr:hypothetical protein AF332_22875 [Sporosarcina globispora]
MGYFLCPETRLVRQYEEGISLLLSEHKAGSDRWPRNFPVGVRTQDSFRQDTQGFAECRPNMIQLRIIIPESAN